jgi:nucleoid DNA-binding protein
MEGESHGPGFLSAHPHIQNSHIISHICTSAYLHINNMLQIQENVSLKNFNTFGVDAKARYFVEINHKDELVELFIVSITDP